MDEELKELEELERMLKSSLRYTDTDMLTKADSLDICTQKIISSDFDEGYKSSNSGISDRPLNTEPNQPSNKNLVKQFPLYTSVTINLMDKKTNIQGRNKPLIIRSNVKKLSK